MQTYPTHSIETAPKDSQPLLRSLKENVGMIPNLAAAMAESPREPGRQRQDGKIRDGAEREQQADRGHAHAQRVAREHGHQHPVRRDTRAPQASTVTSNCVAMLT